MTNDPRRMTHYWPRHREEAWPVLNHSLSVVRHPSSDLVPSGIMAAEEPNDARAGRRLAIVPDRLHRVPGGEARRLRRAPSPGGSERPAESPVPSPSRPMKPIFLVAVA